MTTFLTIVFLLACIALIASVLLQSGKSAGLSGTISGGAEQLFGNKKGKKLDGLFDKITKVAAIVFIVVAMILVIIQ